jgi:hypothetical protein
MYQYEAVIQAMEQLGGYAPLGQLYQASLKIPGAEWGTKTPYATIRRIVQERKEFFKIRPGLWALESYKNKLPEPLKTKKETKAKSKEVQLFDHTYYQGLLVQIGNLQKFITYVPAQDKNRKFLGKEKLDNLATTTKIFDFTYPFIINSAKSIDVIWFNQSKLPKALFEVEHSTDIKNSLIKFVELQDFRTEMNIIADETRRRQFEKVISSRAFKDIQKFVSFVSYKQISDEHTNLFLKNYL